MPPFDPARQVYKAYLKRSKAEREAVRLNLTKPKGWHYPFVVVENNSNLLFKWEVVCWP